MSRAFLIGLHFVAPIVSPPVEASLQPAARAGAANAKSVMTVSAARAVAMPNALRAVSIRKV